MRGHVNKALGYTTAPSAHAEYLIVIRTAQEPVIKKGKDNAHHEEVIRQFLYDWSLAYFLNHLLLKY